MKRKRQKQEEAGWFDYLVSLVGQWESESLRVTEMEMEMEIGRGDGFLSLSPKTLTAKFHFYSVVLLFWLLPMNPFSSKALLLIYDRGWYFFPMMTKAG